MILRPVLAENFTTSSGATNLKPAWAVVARLQSVAVTEYLLISQPDHAQLSGELSALFRAPFLPETDESISKIIAVHDNGWTRIPFERDLKGEPPVTSTGRPKYFTQVSAEEAVAAWIGSVAAGGEISPLGRYMISAHFSRIGRVRLQMAIDTPDDVQRLRNFVETEEQWQTEHETGIGIAREQLSIYVNLLQFCDLLSLYLCCGATEAAEFPQMFQGRQIRIRYDAGVYWTEPSLFGGNVEQFFVPARVYPADGVTDPEERITQLALRVG